MQSAIPEPSRLSYQHQKNATQQSIEKHTNTTPIWPTLSGKPCIPCAGRYWIIPSTAQTCHSVTSMSSAPSRQYYWAIGSSCVKISRPQWCSGSNNSPGLTDWLAGMKEGHRLLLMAFTPLSRTNPKLVYCEQVSYIPIIPPSNFWISSLYSQNQFIYLQLISQHCQYLRIYSDEWQDDERMNWNTWKEAVMVYFKVLSRHLLGVTVETHENLSQDSLCPGRNLNWVPPK
jgi:hypothetical protein